MVSQFWFPFYEICVQNQGILVEDSNTGTPGSITASMEYLLAFQFWYCKLCVENRWDGRQMALFYYLLFFGGALFVGGWGVVRWGRKSYLGPAEIASFFSRDFSRRNKHDKFWRVVLTGYFYLLFSWAIFVSDFCTLKIYKNLGLPLSTITFTLNSHAYKHFYKYIYLFQILYSMKSFFLWNVL